jgi:hypothetical protein
MKERPILFSAPMVRAIPPGTKTQTRRVVRPQPPEILPAYAPKVYWPARDRHMTHGDPDGAAYLQFERPGDYDGAHVMRGGFGFRCPYGQPGDRLWVKETWRVCGGKEYEYQQDPSQVMYRATHQEDGFPFTWESYVWRPSIYMPRWASRITLEVTAIRVERLQDISEADAIAEGAPWAACGAPQEGSHKAGFAQLWESIHGPGSWEANPWVWVVEFRQVQA